ncbi:MAG TPA: L-aspartate oxidase [Gemmatimonadales bacterium]|nr:L-aspartate oxidase [Gemmatimonadales bacterium]
MNAASSARPIVVGSGLAGLWTAWRLAELGCAVRLLTKRTLADSATAWAQGGIAAALAPGDTPALHAADTLAAGDGLAAPEAVRILTTEGPEGVRRLLALGATFDRGPDGRLSFGLEAAHSRPRILHAGGDRTGAMLVQCVERLVSQHPLIEIRENAEVAQLLLADERVSGVVAVLGDGSVAAVQSPAVVLATGGVGQLYAVTTNPLVATGDGWALAHRVGGALRGIEFLQFHPTGLKLSGLNPAPLVSEAVRGAGGTLVDAHGRRFMLDVDPRAELASRDVVARAVARIDRSGGAWLDARHVVGFPARFPGITAMLARHGLDPARELIPVAPAMHYAMGGIATDLAGRSTRPGLWAVGEVAWTGVHGANRLASNSLLEGLVFADRAARGLRAESEHWPRGLLASAPSAELAGTADDECQDLRREMRRVMSEDVGVERSEASLARAGRALLALNAAAPTAAWRTRNQLLVARLIVQAARRRRETRGGHTRVDYPRRKEEPAWARA